MGANGMCNAKGIASEYVEHAEIWLEPYRMIWCSPCRRPRSGGARGPPLPRRSSVVAALPPTPIGRGENQTGNLAMTSWHQRRLAGDVITCNAAASACHGARAWAQILSGPQDCVVWSRDHLEDAKAH